MKNKIGVGYITCNAQDRVKQTLQLIPNVDELIIVNDGDPYNNDIYCGKQVIQHTKNKGVGISKNDAMRHLIQKDCDHIFIIEDDVIIKDEKVFEQYIKTAEVSGIWHMNYALQGPANRKQTKQGPMQINKRHELEQTSEPNPRQIVEYSNDINVALYPNCVGAFTYFIRGVIKAVGYHDERLNKNCWEHCDLTYRIIKAGLHPNWWYFADIDKSWEYLDNIPDCMQKSVIAKEAEWNTNLREGMEYFKHKHGFYPQQIPDTKQEKVMEMLEQIEKNYARKLFNV